MYQPTGTELIEIRRHARLSKFLETPLAPFASLSKHPTSTSITNISEFNSRNQPLQLHRT